MGSWGIVLGAVVGIVVGALAGAAVFSSRSGARRASLAAARAEVGSLSAERDELRRIQAVDRETITRLEVVHEHLVEQVAAQASTLEATIERVSNEVVRRGTDRLTELATERFEGATASLVKDMEVRDERFKREVDPIRQLLEQYAASIHALETKREGAYQSVAKHLEVLAESEEKLRRETQSLVTALRTPTTKGRWGEMQLRRVVEMAGMVEHCDFIEQTSVETDDGLQRPDLVVTLADGAQVVIDAKVPLNAYLEAIDAEDDAVRRERMVAHARQLRTHVEALSKKAYWKNFEPTPAFVVCFVPGESLLAAAFEADPTLVERAMDNRVLLTGPVNLIALLKTVGLGWRQEALAENAREIQQLGHSLYERLGTFAGHLSHVGRSLNRSVESYNQAVGSLEARVLPAARQFGRLGVLGDAVDELPIVTPLEGAARPLNAPEASGFELHPAAGGNADLHLVGDEQDPSTEGA